MNLDTLSPILIALARSGLEGKPAPPEVHEALKNVAWEELTSLADSHGLLGLLGAGAAASRVVLPAETKALLRRTSLIAETRADRAWRQISEINLTRDEGIEAGNRAVRGHQRFRHRKPFHILSLLLKY